VSAEDIVQNAFVTATEKPSAIEHGTNLFAWIKAIVRLKTLEMLRSRVREQSTADEQLLTIELAGYKVISELLSEFIPAAVTHPSDRDDKQKH
jgi:DNA-directed RNA polymerase specialized sigma24 family protein